MFLLKSVPAEIAALTLNVVAPAKTSRGVRCTRRIQHRHPGETAESFIAPAVIPAKAVEAFIAPAVILAKAGDPALAHGAPGRL